MYNDNFTDKNIVINNNLTFLNENNMVVVDIKKMYSSSGTWYEHLKNSFTELFWCYSCRLDIYLLLLSSILQTVVGGCYVCMLLQLLLL